MKRALKKDRTPKKDPGPLEVSEAFQMYSWNTLRSRQRIDQDKLLKALFKGLFVKELPYFWQGKL